MENICESTEKLNCFRKWCRPLCPNGTERNDKNYDKKTTILRPYYGTEFETFFCLLLYQHTDRLTSIQTDYQHTDRHTSIQTDIPTYTQTYQHTHRHTSILTDIPADRHTSLLTDMPADRHTSIPTDILAYRQKDLKMTNR